MDLLRGDRADGGMGFDGLVVTDAMNMGALQGFGTAGELAVQAIQAGIDVVLMPTDLPQAWQAVLAAVQDGTISQQRLDESVRRVLQAKADLGVLDATAIQPGDPSLMGNDDHQAIRDAVQAACAC
jgi:beta-N-acetylhexosaminidase